METYISMLRGINVGGHNMIKMDELKKIYAGLNFKNSQSYIQSGNVIFQYGKTDPGDLQKKLEKKIIETKLSLKLHVILQSLFIVLFHSIFFLTSKQIVFYYYFFAIH